MKIRLVKGPFGGRVMQGDGRNDIIIRDKKKMNRQQQFEWFRNFSDSYNRPFPQVEARYQIAMGNFVQGHTMVYAPLRHPDGSLFYEFVEGSKRELG